MKKVFISIAVIILIVGGFYGWRYYNWIFSANTPSEIESDILLIPKQGTVQGILDSLVKYEQISNPKSFIWVADKMSFSDQSVKAGRYRVEPLMTNRELVHMLRLGLQIPVDLVITPASNAEILYGRIGNQIMLDSSQISDYMRNTFLVESDYTDGTLLSLFIPNTYEVYWNISTEKLIERLKREHSTFWNKTRVKQAKNQNLTPLEVYTLASIVERETNLDSEKPIVAGVYLNRLDRGIMLQADPTVVFAAGDMSIRRVLYKHLEIDSPYNTYKYAGLPPGPIGMASMKSIEGVLQPTDHKYLYFCAKPGATGHLFAETLSQHNRNAQAYRQWLNQNKIY